MATVSVVIPAYNAMKYLPETLSSVLAQTYDDYEIIIVNDGSTDHLEQWVADLNHPKVCLISQANQGLAGARNTGIQSSHGQYIALLDADDVWHPTKLAKQIQRLDQYPDAGLVYTWSVLIDDNGQSTGRVFTPNADGNVWKTLIESNVVGGGSVPLIRRECFEKVGWFDSNLKSFVEDWDLWLRIAPFFEFRVVKEPLVFYRQIPSSASMNWEAMERSFQMVLEKAFANAPAELQYLKPKSYGLANLYLAWKPLKSKMPSLSAAWKFQRKALIYYPRIVFSREFMRLSVSIILNQCFGSEVYRKLLSKIYALRRRFAHLS